MNKNFKIILNSKKKRNYLVTVAIGKKTFEEWNKYAKRLWLKYCKKYSLGLIVITNDLIDKRSFLEKSNMAKNAYRKLFKSSWS